MVMTFSCRQTAPIGAATEVADFVAIVDMSLGQRILHGGQEPAAWPDYRNGRKLLSMPRQLQLCFSAVPEARVKH
jgi:hypothetical protein